MNNDLISRSALLKKAIEEKRFVFRVEDLLREEVIFQTVYKDLASFILSAPAVDAAEVVRCKDCRNRNHDGTGKPWCVALEVYLPDNEDFFCGYGERRAEYTITAATITMDEPIRFEDLGQEA